MDAANNSLVYAIQIHFLFAVIEVMFTGGLYSDGKVSLAICAVGQERIFMRSFRNSNHMFLICITIRQYLEENVHQTYVDVGVMARHLQEKYREYTRRKAQPFRFLVDQGKIANLLRILLTISTNYPFFAISNDTVCFSVPLFLSVSFD